MAISKQIMTDIAVKRFCYLIAKMNRQKPKDLSLPVMTRIRTFIGSEFGAISSLRAFLIACDEYELSKLMYSDGDTAKAEKSPHELLDELLSRA